MVRGAPATAWPANAETPMIKGLKVLFGAILVVILIRLFRLPAGAGPEQLLLRSRA